MSHSPVVGGADWPGGTVARLALAHGHRVRALARDRAQLGRPKFRRVISIPGLPWGGCGNLS